MEYDKPFKTYDEQIDILINEYGLIINDREFAKIALQSLTYYDLVNGYKDCLMENGKFKNGISIEFLHAFCYIDKTFQNAIFKYSAIIENLYKSKLAYVLSESFGVCTTQYLDPSNFFKSFGKLQFTQLQDHCLGIFNQPPHLITKIPQPTQHYYLNHNHIPAWILFKNVTFGNAINFIKFLKKPEKEKLVNLLLPNTGIAYDKKVDLAINSLYMIKSYRNVIAHNLKFITHKDPINKISINTATTVFPRRLLGWKDINKHNRGINDIYSDILCILLLLNDKSLITLFGFELLGCFRLAHQLEKNINIPIVDHYSKITNLPPDFENRLQAFLNIKQSDWDK